MRHSVMAASSSDNRERCEREALVPAALHKVVRVMNPLMESLPRQTIGRMLPLGEPWALCNQ